MTTAVATVVVAKVAAKEEERVGVVMAAVGSNSLWKGTE